MVLDSSAIVAIHLREPGYECLIDKVETAEAVVVGVPTLLETAMVLTARLGQDARPILFAFLRRLEAEVIPFNESTWTPPPPRSSVSDAGGMPPP